MQLVIQSIVVKKDKLLACHSRICHPLLVKWRERCYLVIQVFEKGNFAGLEEMKTNDRLFRKIAPIGVNDIMMAVQYEYVHRPPLSLPIVSFDGIKDATIDAGNMQQWAQYTTSTFSNVPIEGDHYFVSTRYREVCFLDAPPAFCTCAYLDISWPWPSTCYLGIVLSKRMGN